MVHSVLVLALRSLSWTGCGDCFSLCVSFGLKMIENFTLTFRIVLAWIAFVAT